jgi:Leucine-rich repeat (LRR) protein
MGQLKNVIKLELGHYKHGRNPHAPLPEGIGQLQSLMDLKIDGFLVKQLPSELCLLRNLKSLDVSSCPELSTLPSEIGGGNLEKLSIHNCPSLNLLNGSKLRSNPRNLTTLKLSSCGPISEAEIQPLGRLKVLRVVAVQRFPTAVLNLTMLRRLDLVFTTFFRDAFDAPDIPSSIIPSEIGQLRQLERLGIHASKVEFLPEEICELTNLKVLSLRQCEELLSLPEDIGNLSKLRRLEIDGCKRLDAVPPTIGLLEGLEELALTNLPVLTRFPEELKAMKVLKHLDLSGNTIPESFLWLFETPWHEDCAIESLNLGSCRLKDHHLRQTNFLSGLPKSLVKLKIGGGGYFHYVGFLNKLQKLPEEYKEFQHLDACCHLPHKQPTRYAGTEVAERLIQVLVASPFRRRSGQKH